MAMTYKQLMELQKAGKIRGFTEYEKGNKARTKNKFGAIKVVVDDIEFDSKKEAERYKVLKGFLKLGLIAAFARQVEYVFHIKGDKIASYFADFQYLDMETMQTVVEDVKSEATRKLPVYRLKRRMMLAQYKIKITEL